MGAGSWGVTLAKLLAENGNRVKLWCYLQNEYDMLRACRERQDILPGVILPGDVELTTDPMVAVGGATALFFVVPSAGVRKTARLVKHVCESAAVAVSAAKGLEEDTNLRMTEVLDEELGGRVGGIVAFSGPTHAEEVSRRIPSAIVAASSKKSAAEIVRDLSMTAYFRVYTNDDVVGVEYGGALKNIIAIAAGAMDGIGYGDNTKAALMTRGLAEMSRLGVARGARAETFAGLSGLGDLITTCASTYSRNRFVGQELGKGRRLKDILAAMTMVAEGVRTTKVAYALGREMGVEMPITAEMYHVMFEGKDPREAAAALMGRPPRSELEG